MSHWITKSAVYHIYPLGFCGCERFHSEAPEKPVHRIRKVIEWISHIKSMKMTAVYFGPVFESFAHGYDTSDYKKIDVRLGTNEDFSDVCRALHENGIRVILDGVFNHVGRDHFAFLDVRKNREKSRYCSWFCNLNFGGNSPYNDGFWYEGWNNCYDLVKLNLNNNEVVEYLLDAIGMWIDEWDIDGIRFDAADCLTHDFIKRVHSFTRSKKSDFWLMGEIIHGNYKIWANPEMFDCVTNYQCYKGIYSSHNDRNYFEIAHSIEYQLGQYGDTYMYNFVDNHDVTRLATQLKNPDHIYCCYTLLYMMYGVPSVYYGSEFGITGAKGRGELADAEIRPCLELDDIPHRNDRLVQHISALGAVRSQFDAIQTGSYSKMELKNQTFLFKREKDGTEVYVALNISDGDYTFNFNTKYERLADRLTGRQFDTRGGKASVTVPKNSSMILVDDAFISAPVQGDEEISYPGSESSSASESPASPASAPLDENIRLEVSSAETAVSEVAEVTFERKPAPADNENRSNTWNIINSETESKPAPVSAKGTPSKGVPEGRKIVIGGHYKHFKGGDYVVLNVAKDHETLEEQVVYIQIYDKPQIWVRPLSMFLDDVDDHGNIKPRFALTD